MINPQYDEEESETGGAASTGMPAADGGVSGGGSTGMLDASGGQDGSGSAETGASEDSGQPPDGDSGDAPSWSFEMVEPVDALNSDEDDDDPSLRTDLLEIYFASRRLGEETVFVSTRASPDDSWDAPFPVEAFEGYGTVSSPELSADGLTLTLSVDTGVLTLEDIWIATRPSVDAPWSAPVPFDLLNTAGFESAAVFADDPTEMLLCATRLDTEGWTDLYAIHIDAGAERAQFERVLALSSEAADCDVYVGPSGSMVVFATDRAGQWDLWRGARAGDDWDEVQAIPDLNTDGDDSDPWYSPAAGVFYFARDDGSGYDIYRAQSVIE